MPPYPRVTDWCRKITPKFDILGTAQVPERLLNCNSDDILFSAPNEFPFHCLKSLSSTLRRQLSTVSLSVISLGCPFKQITVKVKNM
jgi:hypothetical protein